jgi:hypothetical protein
VLGLSVSGGVPSVLGCVPGEGLRHGRPHCSHPPCPLPLACPANVVLRPSLLACLLHSWAACLLLCAGLPSVYPACACLCLGWLMQAALYCVTHML